MIGGKADRKEKLQKNSLRMNFQEKLSIFFSLFSKKCIKIIDNCVIKLLKSSFSSNFTILNSFFLRSFYFRKSGYLG